MEKRKIIKKQGNKITYYLNFEGRDLDKEMIKNHISGTVEALNYYINLNIKEPTESIVNHIKDVTNELIELNYGLVALSNKEVENE